MSVRLCDGIIRECNIMKKSGKHVVKNKRKDLVKIVQSLVANDAMTEKPGRQYNHFKNVPRSSLSAKKLSGLGKWINDHKNAVIMGRKAR